jgi:hypothetical protein
MSTRYAVRYGERRGMGGYLVYSASGGVDWRRLQHLAHPFTNREQARLNAVRFGGRVVRVVARSKGKRA